MGRISLDPSRGQPERSEVTSRWWQLVLSVGRQLRYGRLVIALPDGSRHEFQGASDGPSGELVLHRARAIRRFATGGALGFAEAFLDGDWDSPDLALLLELLARNEAALAERYYGGGWSRWLARLYHRIRPNSRRGSRRNIHAHYDLGNEFYRRWLDETMTYSSACFERPDLPLAEAQRAKYRRLAERLGLAPEHHVLEIGCGWGGFAEFAAKEIGAKVTGITISAQQHDFAAARIQAAGLNERVEIRLQDYRDVAERYDRIASIEMFEAVGERYWPTYFGKLGQCLKPGGIAGLQIITIADRYFDAYRRSVDFIQRYVFPGGMLPSPTVLEAQIRRAGLATLDVASFGRDYAKTLATWHQRFQAAWPELRTLGFDQRFERLWRYYLAYCEAGFRVGFTDVRQIAVKAG